jgi:hypothetical protein
MVDLAGKSSFLQCAGGSQRRLPLTFALPRREEARREAFCESTGSDADRFGDSVTSPVNITSIATPFRHALREGLVPAGRD